MDTKSKNINREEENKLDIKKEKSNSKRTFKKNSNKKYIIYILTVIVLVTAILSGLEVKDNLGYVIPDRIYTQTQVAGNISVQQQKPITQIKKLQQAVLIITE